MGGEAEIVERRTEVFVSQRALGAIPVREHDQAIRADGRLVCDAVEHIIAFEGLASGKYLSEP